MGKDLTKADAALQDEWNSLKPKAVVGNRSNVIKLANKSGEEDFGSLIATHYIPTPDGDVFTEPEEVVTEINIEKDQFLLLRVHESPSFKMDSDSEALYYFKEAQQHCEDIQIVNKETNEVYIQCSNPWSLREHPDFKDTQLERDFKPGMSIFVKFNDHYYKWRMSGCHLRNLSGMIRELSKLDAPTYFKVAMVQEIKEKGKNYNVLHFKVTDEQASIKEAVEGARELQELLTAYNSVGLPQIEAPKEEKEEMDMGDSPSDLPFG
jgi:hypothetical protein